MAGDTLATMVDTFNQKKLALKAILELGKDLTQEKLEDAKRLKPELDDLQSRITEFQTVGAYKTDVEGYDAFLKEPVRQIPFSRSAGDSNVIGSYKAGDSYMEKNKDGKFELVYEDGEGVYGQKAWKAITDPDYPKAFRAILRAGGNTGKVSVKAMKLLEEGLDDQGGYTVPIDSMINKVIERKPTPTRIRGMVDSVNTSREVVEMLKLNYKTDNIYTTGFRVTKTGENPASASAAQITDSNLFGTIKVSVHTFMIRGLLTKNQIEDSALNLEDFLSGKFSETNEILYDDKIVNGTNKMEPAGLVNSVAGTGSGSGLDDPLITYIPTGDASAITADSLMDLALDVPEQYEDACRYLFNKTSTFKAIRKLKDLNDRYLFGAGYQDSGLVNPLRPTDLNGYPFSYSGLMPNVAANNIPVLFGDLKGYLFVNRIGFSVQILRELYAELNQVAIVGRVRFGGQVTEPWRMRALKVSVT